MTAVALRDVDVDLIDGHLTALALCDVDVDLIDGHLTAVALRDVDDILEGAHLTSVDLGDVDSAALEIGALIDVQYTKLQVSLAQCLQLPSIYYFLTSVLKFLFVNPHQVRRVSDDVEPLLVPALLLVFSISFLKVIGATFRLRSCYAIFQIQHIP